MDFYVGTVIMELKFIILTHVIYFCLCQFMKGIEYLFACVRIIRNFAIDDALNT